MITGHQIQQALTIWRTHLRQNRSVMELEAEKALKEFERVMIESASHEEIAAAYDRWLAADHRAKVASRED